MSSAASALVWKMSWQVAILAAVVWLITRFARKAPASWRHALWLVVLVKFFIPPFAYLPIQRAAEPSPAPVVTHASPVMVQHQVTKPVGSPAARPEPAPVPAPDADRPPVEIPISAVLIICWLAGACATGAVLIIRVRRQVNLFRGAMPADKHTLDVLMQCAKQMSVARVPDLRLSEAARTPMLVGLLRPTILLPRDVQPSCSETDLRAMLLHELAHVKRWDMAVLWIEQIARVAFFFHPALWLAGHELARERELACDELVLRASGISRNDYASGYVSALAMASSASRTAVALAMAEPFEVEKRRLQSILHNPLRKLTWAWIVALALICAVALPTFVGCARRAAVKVTARKTGDNIVYVYKKPIVWKRQGLTWKITGIGHLVGPDAAPGVTLTSQVPIIPHRKIDIDAKARAAGRAVDPKATGVTIRDGARFATYDFEFSSPPRGATAIDELSGTISIRPENSVHRRGPFDANKLPELLELEKGKLIVATYRDRVGRVPRLTSDMVDGGRAAAELEFVCYAVTSRTTPPRADVDQVTLYDAAGRKAESAGGTFESVEERPENLGLDVYFGMQMASVSLSKQKTLNIAGGKMVTCVDPLGPARRAGVRKGDIITEWEGRAVSSGKSVSYTATAHPHSLTVVRNGKAIHLSVTPVRDPYWYDSNGNLKPIWSLVQQAKRRLGPKATIGRLTYTYYQPSGRSFVPAKIEFRTRVERKALKVIPFTIRDIPIPKEFWAAPKKVIRPAAVKVSPGPKPYGGGLALKYAKPYVWHGNGITVSLTDIGRSPSGPGVPDPQLVFRWSVKEDSGRTNHRYMMATGMSALIEPAQAKLITANSSYGGTRDRPLEQTFNMPLKGTPLICRCRNQLEIYPAAKYVRSEPSDIEAARKPREISKGILTAAVAGWSIGDHRTCEDGMLDASGSAQAKDYFKPSDLQTATTGFLSLALWTVAQRQGAVSLETVTIWGADGHKVDLDEETGSEYVPMDGRPTGDGDDGYYGFVMKPVSPRPHPKTVVLAVDPRGPAWNAGLRPGDQVVQFLDDQMQRQGYINMYPSRQPLKMTVVRARKTIRLTIRPEFDPCLRPSGGVPPVSWNQLSAKAPYGSKKAFGTYAFTSRNRIPKSFRPVKISIKAIIYPPAIRRVPFTLRNIPIPREIWSKQVSRHSP